MQLSQLVQLRCTVAQTTAPRTITFSSLSSLSKCGLALDADPCEHWLSDSGSCLLKCSMISFESMAGKAIWLFVRLELAPASSTVPTNE